MRPPTFFSPFFSGALAVAATAVLVAATPPAFVWRAVIDFTPVRDAAFVPPYAEAKDPDASLHGLAVNTRQHRDRFAATDLVFSGSAGTYTIELLAVAEEDGESVYRLAVNDTVFDTRTNPTTAEKRRPVKHRWTRVALRPGDRIAVHFAGRSNGRIPEGDAFAWSRGRWRTLQVFRETPP